MRTNYHIAKDLLRTGDNILLTALLKRITDRKDPSFFIERPSLLHIAITNQNIEGLRILINKLSYSLSRDLDDDLPSKAIIKNLDANSMRVILNCDKITDDNKKDICYDALRYLFESPINHENKLQQINMVNLIEVFLSNHHLIEEKGRDHLRSIKASIKTNLYGLSKEEAIREATGGVEEEPQEHPFFALKELIMNGDNTQLKELLDAVTDRHNNQYLEHDKLGEDSLMNIAVNHNNLEAFSLLIDKLSYSKSSSFVSQGLRPLGNALIHCKLDFFISIFVRLRDILSEEAFKTDIIRPLKFHFTEDGMVKEIEKGKTDQEIENNLFFIRACKSNYLVAPFLIEALDDAEHKINQIIEHRQRLTNELTSLGVDLSETHESLPPFIAGAGAAAGGGVGAAAGGGGVGAAAGGGGVSRL
jgi:hypothetical protein